jgi:hypothetical protein
MKLHDSTVTKLLGLFSSLGGHSNENKLRDALSRLDLTVYEQNKEAALANNNPNLINRVLVPTDLFQEKLKEANIR